jgi:hypothetical protein
MRRLALAALAVFVTQTAIAGALMSLLPRGLVEDPTLSRPEGDERVVPYMISRVLFAALYAGIFAFWRESRGSLAGLRYGLIIWLLYSVPMTVGFWAFMRMPDAMAAAWLGVGLAEYAVSGIVLGLVCPPNAVLRTMLGEVQ